MKTLIIMLASLVILSSCTTPTVQKPVEEIKAVKIHNCEMCHLPHQKSGAGKILLNKPVNELCSSCHATRAGTGEHKVAIKPTMPVAELPLDSEGKITCITCHDPHGSKGYGKLLRAPDFNALCQKCHMGY